MVTTRRVFVLEDDPERIRYFKETFGNETDLTLVSSCTEADQFQPPYDAIFFDHDLGGRQLEDHEDCGLTFVKQVYDRIEPADVIVVHSYNSIGARRMLDALPPGYTAIYSPFRGKEFDRIVELLFKVWGELDALKAERAK